MSFNHAKLALEETRFVDIRSVAETGSTNADMREILGREPSLVTAAGSDAPIVLMADHQSAGRGRMDRTWQAPAGSSILMTIGYPATGLPVERRTLLMMCLSLAVTDAIASEGIDGVSLKWPNDVVVEDSPDAGDSDSSDGQGYRKLGGILAELVSLPGRGDWVLLGIGLNVTWPELPAELANLAASLNQLTNRPVERERLVQALLMSLDTNWLPLIEEADRDLSAMFDVYRDRCSTIGRMVRVELPTSSLVGMASDVTGSGALVVVVDGESRVINAADVVHLRPVI